MSDKEKRGRAEGLPQDKLERNTLTLSIVIVILGLMCLPSVEQGGSTWYVLMFVFIINAALLAWILFRIVHRILRERRAEK